MREMPGRRWRRSAWALWSSRHGGIATYLAFAALIVLPLTGIAIDVTRLYTLDTELQQAADAAALAAAAALDGTETGCAAARTAAKDAVRNGQSFATDDGGADVRIATLTFLRRLPTAPATDYGRHAAAACDEARYVRLSTETRVLQSYPMRAFLALVGGPEGASRPHAFATAVAGRVAVACRTLPLMMCNPVEVAPAGDCGAARLRDDPDVVQADSTNGSLRAFLAANPAWHRRLFRLTWAPPGAPRQPGTFGLIDTVYRDRRLVPGTVETFGIEDPPICVPLDGRLVDGDGDAARAMVDGVNVRFDIYRGEAAAYRGDPRFRPARNVTKGLVSAAQGGSGGLCDPTGAPDIDDPRWMKLPQDRCLAGDSAPDRCLTLGGNGDGPAGGRIGDGQWAIEDYLRVNHPAAYQTHAVAADGVTPVASDDPDLVRFLRQIRDSVPRDDYVDDRPVTGTEPPSRYAVYRWETAGDRTPGAATREGGVPVEEGNRPAPGQQCATAGAAPDDRRKLSLAVVNCCAQKAALGAGGREVRITEFAQAFLTEPASAGGGGAPATIHVEVVRAFAPDEADGIVLRDYVQLF
jgi:Flp pilus assembly protein TadG